MMDFLLQSARAQCLLSEHEDDWCRTNSIRENRLSSPRVSCLGLGQVPRPAGKLCPGLSSRRQLGCTELNCVPATPTHGRPEAVNAALSGNRVFADVIKLR